MNHQKYYGTIIHWFEDMGRGSILPDDFEQRIFADKLSLAAHYPSPKSGDRVCFDIDRSRRQPAARNIEAADGRYRPGEKAVVILSEWDLMQNGGYGTEQGGTGRHVFVLGQFLADQSRVPEIGERLEGRLKRHDNGQWLLIDAAAVEHEAPPAPPQDTIAKPAIHYTAQTFYQAPEPESQVYLPAKQVMSGTISHWDDDKGYGFIHLNKKSPKIFFHISDFHCAGRRPDAGLRVSFYCLAPVDGRQKAARVVLAGDEAYLSHIPPEHVRPAFDTATLLCCLAAAAYLSTVLTQSYKLAAAYFAFRRRHFVVHALSA